MDDCDNNEWGKFETIDRIVDNEDDLVKKKCSCCGREYYEEKDFELYPSKYKVGAVDTEGNDVNLDEIVCKECGYWKVEWR